jgi:hypothetical protein
MIDKVGCKITDSESQLAIIRAKLLKNDKEGAKRFIIALDENIQELKQIINSL